MLMNLHTSMTSPGKMAVKMECECVCMTITVPVLLTVLYACHLYWFVMTVCSMPSTDQQLPAVQRDHLVYHNCDRHVGL